MNRISIVITLSSLILGAPVASHATDYYIVAASSTTLSTEHNADIQSNPGNVIAVWSDDKLCNRFSEKNTRSTEQVNVTKHKKSMIAPRMSRNMKE
ncbi:MAG TPA: hypothetical protein ENI64_07380 [Gammaproteobacteria bacterium]|nr:hypothetical protein [Gammaproteobacteria bacterium]